MKVYFDTVGCRLNQAEIEYLARQFSAAGHQIVEKASLADLVVVNTCAVTTEAASDSRGKVRAAAQQGAAQIIVTGCWATLDPESAAALPGVRRVVPNQSKDLLAEQELNIPLDELLAADLLREPLPGSHHRTRAFIKVQDGCNNHCTYCITRIARGESRSLQVNEILHTVQQALDSGVQEIVLTAVHLGAWGRDLLPSLSLRDLLSSLLTETSAKRIRLSSLEPWDLDQHFFDLWQDGRLMPHFHLPLQSGSAGVLKRMARNTTPEAYTELVARIRGAIPDAAISTDIIVGFPGETDEEFEESVRFVEKMHFSGGHIFRYSPRPGTAAANLPNPVSSKEKKRRAQVMRQLIAASQVEYETKWLGKTVDVLWESARPRENGSWMMSGLAGNYLRVQAITLTACQNQIATVLLETVTSRGLFGRVISSVG